MADNFYNVFYYLKKENINIGKKEFLFQVQSHPNYPSLLAITDTLSFFNIDNRVLDVNFDQIDLLPNRFLIILKEKINDTHIYFVELKNGRFFIMRNDKFESISKDELKSRWGNFVLFAEKSDDNFVEKKSQNKLIRLLQCASILFFFLNFLF